jgi:hypothetical protein
LARKEPGKLEAGNRPCLNCLQTPTRTPTSIEVIGIKGASDRVAGRAVTPTLQTLVLLLGRVELVVTANNLQRRDEGEVRAK